MSFLIIYMFIKKIRTKKSTGMIKIPVHFWKPKYLKVMVLSCIIFFSYTSASTAQIVQFEWNPGNNKNNLNSMISTSLDSDRNYQLVNISIFNQFHNANDKMFDGGVNHFYLYRGVFRNISVGPGISYIPSRGLIPKISSQYRYIGESFLLQVSPGIAYDEHLNFELLIGAARTFSISNNWSFILELRLMNNIGEFKWHKRSIRNFRASLKYGSYIFGAGIEIDQFGPHRHKILNTGVFIRHQIF